MQSFTVENRLDVTELEAIDQNDEEVAAAMFRSYFPDSGSAHRRHVPSRGERSFCAALGQPTSDKTTSTTLTRSRSEGGDSAPSTRDPPKALVDYDSSYSSEGSSSNSSTSSSSYSSSSSSDDDDLEDEIKRKEDVIRRKDKKATRLIEIIRQNNKEILELKARDLQRQRQTWKIVAEAKKTKDELIAKNLEIKCLLDMTEEQLQSLKLQNEWIKYYENVIYYYNTTMYNNQTGAVTAIHGRQLSPCMQNTTAVHSTAPQNTNHSDVSNSYFSTSSPW
jgi:hypothetical protein